MRRTLLAILAEEIQTPGGKLKVTKFRAVMENLVADAAKGNPTALIQLMRLIEPALQERIEAHNQVMLAEYFRQMSESADPEKKFSYQDARIQMNIAKDKY